MLKPAADLHASDIVTTLKQNKGVISLAVKEIKQQFDLGQCRQSIAYFTKADAEGKRSKRMVRHQYDDVTVLYQTRADKSVSKVQVMRRAAGIEKLVSEMQVAKADRDSSAQKL